MRVRLFARLGASFASTKSRAFQPPIKMVLCFYLFSRDSLVSDYYREVFMQLFRRFPKLHPLPKEEQFLISPAERSKYPAFAGDFETLERELMPRFRELDNEALRRQNWYRWMFVILIFGGSLVTILGIVQLAYINAAGIGIAGAIVAALLGVATSASRAFHHQERYLNARLAAERLRSEYFLYLGHMDLYADEQDRVQKLIQRVLDIKAKGEHYESA